ncbi:phosphonate C-P lyase system protein PhnG [Gracilibacillus oryzae]|uniref:Phosphonate C-P lyase system protein PhnG n=1 Tax=Gracilibacillus oryzae TaxID=1672701 RepID=A0A7C8GTQ4_9BACI|nr:phosphonate C-P lyase system protein PhnG [Gracilibacillus oryzae]KAB8137773.1 phosphonate C-P lyase system protein PhnG [Gracilibacillus oryzae]
MKRKRRTEILIEGDPSLAKELSEMILHKYRCKELVAPRQGMTMVKMRETAKNSLFYIGEVLITEAKVEVMDHIGAGIVVGIKEELAKQLAIIDAAYKAALPETEEWGKKLMEEEQRIKQAKIQEQEELLKTKVLFETMDV